MVLFGAAVQSKWERTFVKRLVWVAIVIVAVTGISIGSALVLHRKYFVAEEQRVIAQAANASTTGGASHMEFRGLHAGLTRAEVETLLRKLDENSALECDKPENGLYSCHSSGISADPDMASVGFSSEDGLVDFHWMLNSHSGENSDEFFTSLRQELAAANHKQGKASTSLSGEFASGLTWRTDRTVVCPMDQKKNDCPAEAITLDDTYLNLGSADIWFSDNAYFSRGMSTRD
jgi:hypothetical protein